MYRTKQMVRLALLVAIGILLFYFVAFPLPFFPTFLTYDAGDIPGIIAAFALGPWAGVLVQFLKAFIGLLIGASTAGWVGAAANFVAGGTMVLVAGLVYARNKTKTTAILALLAGSVATSIVMGVANYFFFFPIWGVPADFNMLATVVIPFNFVKFVLTSVVTFPLYKRVKSFIEVENYQEAAENK